MIDVENFIAQYDETDEDGIRFDWNGQHADEFEDHNLALRRKVIDFVIDDLDAISLILLRDLYRAETALSKEAWGINRCVEKLAEALLRRGGKDYLKDYLIGKGQSFDAMIATSAFKLDAATAQELLAEVEQRLQTTADEQERRLYELGRQVFEGWIDRSENTA